MPLVQRITENQFSPPSSGMGSSAFLIARSNVQRVYLGLCLPPNTGTTVVSTMSQLDTAKNATITLGNSGVPRWELFRKLHGALTTAEWWCASSALAGGVAIVVFEVLEEDTGEPRSAGGVIIGRQGAMLDGAPYSQVDPADRLRAAILNNARAVPRVLS